MSALIGGRKRPMHWRMPIQIDRMAAAAMMIVVVCKEGGPGLGWAAGLITAISRILKPIQFDCIGSLKRLFRRHRMTLRNVKKPRHSAMLAAPFSKAATSRAPAGAKDR